MLYSYIAVASIFLRFGLLVSSSSSFCFAFNSKLSVLILCGCVIEPATSFRYTICYFVFSSFSCCCLPTWHCFFVFFLIRLIHCVCVFSGHTIHYVYFPSFVIDPILDRSSTGWCVLMALSLPLFLCVCIPCSCSLCLCGHLWIYGICGSLLVFLFS